MMPDAAAKTTTAARGRPLSSRQREILTWAARGHGYKQIAFRLGVGIATIKSQLDGARHKLGAANVTHAVAIGLTAGDITLTEVG